MRSKILVLVLALGLPLAAPASADPGLQPGFVEAMCPRPGDTNCATIAYPMIDVWAVAGIVPMKPGAEAAYDSLIPEPFTPPPSGRREIAVLMFRLDIPTHPNASIDTDPGEGYAEGSVAIRVGFPAEDGFPYTEGWWDLAQPLNDPSQYGAGRGVGLPKYMGDAGVRRMEDGTWQAHAVDWGKRADQADEPGSSPVEDGNVLTIDWTPADPGVSAERAGQLWSWGQYGEPLFLETSPYDEDGDHDPAMVKFTTTGLTPLYGVPRTAATEYPDPVLGTATIRLEGQIPGPGPTVTAMDFSEIVEPGQHVVGGTVAYARGHAFLTTDNLSDNQAS